MSGGGRHTATSTRGRDEAREATDAEVSAPTGVWDRIRAFYPPQVQSLVDAVAEAGGLSLADIELLELAEHERIMGMVSAYMRQEQDVTLPDGKVVKGRSRAIAVTNLMSLRLQSRKHLRTLRIAMTPIGSANDIHPKLPAALAERLSLTEADPHDLGDELVS